METHVRNIGWILLVLGILGAVGGIITLISFGGYEGLFGTDDPFYKRKDIGSIPVGRLLAACYLTFSIVMAGPLIAAGRGLLQWKPWSRATALLVGAVNMLSFPVGTAVGVYVLWVLMDESIEPLFTNPPLQRR